VAFLHSKKIAHCDLKPDNFLFLTKAEDSPLKVIDFGMAKFVERRKYFKSFCGTPFYVAPEVIRGKYAESCDMWSLGVVMFVMLFGFPPFSADQEKYGSMTDDKILSLVKKGFTAVTKKGYGPWYPAAVPASDSAKDLISRLLTLDTAKRYTADEALDHEWLKGKTASEEPILKSVVDNIGKFSGSTKFKTAVLQMMSDSLTNEELKQLEKTFRSIDTNKDGTITFLELSQAFEKEGKDMKVSKEEIEKLMKMADVNGDGVLSYEELKMVYTNRKLVAKEERIWLAFCKIDVNGDGKISKQEIAQVLGTEDQSEIAELLKDADKNGDGEIDYDEFIGLWSKQYGVQEKKR